MIKWQCLLHKCDCVNIVFTENININESDAIIIIGAAQTYIDKKVTEIINNCPKDTFHDCHKHKSTKSIQTILNDKLLNIIVIGANKANDKIDIEKLGGYAFNAIPKESKNIVVYSDLSTVNKNAASLLASGILLKSRFFDKYKNKSDKKKLESIICQSNYEEDDRNYFEEKKNVIDGVFLTRDLVDEPANIMGTDKLMQISLELKKCGKNCTCWQRINF